MDDGERTRPDGSPPCLFSPSLHPNEQGPLTIRVVSGSLQVLVRESAVQAGGDSGLPKVRGHVHAIKEGALRVHHELEVLHHAKEGLWGDADAAIHELCILAEELDDALGAGNHRRCYDDSQILSA